MTAPGPKRVPTPEEFAKFLLWLSQDPDVNVQEYEKIRKKMAGFFLRKGCLDPDELAAETMDRAVIKYADGDCYPNALALCHGIAWNIWKEDSRKPKPGELPNDDVLPSRVHETEERERKAGCIEACLSKLSPGCRNLITRYYQGKGREKIEIRRLLAADHGGENTLRIKAFRIRGKLRVCVDDCMQRFSVN